MEASKFIPENLSRKAKRIAASAIILAGASAAKPDQSHSQAKTQSALTSELSSHSHHADSAKMLFLKGINLPLYGGGADPLPSQTLSEYCASSFYCTNADITFKRLHQKDHINLVDINIPLFQSSATSDYVYANTHTKNDNGTPTDAVLSNLTQVAQRDGLQVMWSPIVDEGNLGGYRGEKIQPRHLKLWENSYDKQIIHYAKLANKNNVYALSEGKELDSMEKNGAMVRLADKLRPLLKSKLTYSFNWSGAKYDTNRITPLTSKLDFAGLDDFMDVQGVISINPSVDSIYNVQQKTIVPFIKQMEAQMPANVPLVIEENGLPSQENGVVHPWHWTDSSLKTDLQGQANYFAAECRPKGVRSFVNGLIIWAVGPFDWRKENYKNIVNSDAVITTPAKPAEAIIAQQCMS